MGNIHFITEFPSAHAIFQPYRVSDHAPCILKFPGMTRDKPKPFKFLNFLVHKAGFKEEVAKAWDAHLEGFSMYQVVCKLKSLKTPMRKLLYAHGNLHKRVKTLRSELDEIQKNVDTDPGNATLREAEISKLNSFQEAVLDEERFLKHKSKIKWLQGGTALNAFVSHYSSFLSSTGSANPFSCNGILSKRLSSQKALDMIRQVTTEEIKDAMFDIGNDKAPGPDVYTSAFFKSS
uniref:uncharacterized protein LOC122610306 n=1 Tax=Erigeron canadensis TaxID=72917 RepID=UPI001CB8EB8F|nr:uncharacterized protein LOC122610306 [Erigeron canadensis]